MDKLTDILSWAVVLSGSAVCVAGGIFLAWCLLWLVGGALWFRLMTMHGIVKINRAAKALREGEIK